MTRTAGAVLGFDYGTQRIGVAVGQTITGSASALTTVGVIHQKPHWEEIDRLVSQWQPLLCVVGLPLGMDGTEHDMTRRARHFGHQLQARYRLPIEFVDERLSSVAAEERLRESGARRGQKRAKASVDRIAAQVILETWLRQQS